MTRASAQQGRVSSSAVVLSVLLPLTVTSLLYTAALVTCSLLWLLFIKQSAAVHHLWVSEKLLEEMVIADKCIVMHNLLLFFPYETCKLYCNFWNWFKLAKMCCEIHHKICDIHGRICCENICIKYHALRVKFAHVGGNLLQFAIQQFAQKLQHLQEICYILKDCFQFAAKLATFSSKFKEWIR